MKNMKKRAERRDAEKLRKSQKYEPGTQIETSDRIYVVDAGGSLRVLRYK